MGALDLVHGVAGAFEELLRILVGVVHHSPAETRTDAYDRTFVKCDRRRDRPGHADREFLDSDLAGDLVEQDDELVAAETDGGVVGPDDSAEAPRGGDEHMVAGGVAVDVIDLLEAVQVGVHERDRSAGTSKPPTRLAQALEQEAAGRQPGENVAQRSSRGQSSLDDDSPAGDEACSLAASEDGSMSVHVLLAVEVR